MTEQSKNLNLGIDLTYMGHSTFKVKTVEGKILIIDPWIMGNRKVSGKLFGEAYDSMRHEFKNDIKAVTYHELKIEETGDTLMAEITFDI